MSDKATQTVARAQWETDLIAASETVDFTLSPFRVETCLNVVIPVVMR